MHFFRANDVLLQTGTDVIVLYPLRGAVTKFISFPVSEITTFSCISEMTSWCLIRCPQFVITYFERVDYGFLVVFHENCTSIIHGFRDNDAFLKTGNDVMVISLLRGAVRISR